MRTLEGWLSERVEINRRGAKGAKKNAEIEVWRLLASSRRCG